MKRVLVGIRSPTGFARLDSDEMSDQDAGKQLASIAQAKEKGPDTLIKLPWLVILASDVVFARTASTPAVTTGTVSPSNVARLGVSQSAQKARRRTRAR
jgi:hypothetical protein